MEPVEMLVAKLGSDDGKEAFAARRKLDEAVSAAGAPDQAAQRQELAAALASQMTATRQVSDGKDDKGNEKFRTEPLQTPRTKNGLLQYLALVGSDEQVPVIASALADLELREMARWALDRMAGSASTDALARAAVDSLGAEFRSGVINALGRRAGSQVVEVLSQCTTDREPLVRLAAVEALSKQGVVAADEPIARIADAARGTMRNRAVRARIRLAENLGAKGEKDSARKILQSILAGQPAEPQKKAAQSALDRLA